MRLLKHSIASAFAVLSLTGSLCGQNINHLGFFPTIDHSGTLSDKWAYGLYYFSAFNVVNDKFEGESHHPGYFIFYGEQSISYQLSKNISFTGSYVYERLNPTKNDYRNENRLYFQTAYKPKINRTELKFRVRYDARFIQDREIGNRPFTSRIRTLLGVSTPIRKNSKCYFSAYNEWFFNTFTDATVTYGENWAYAGIGVRVNKMAFEAGPLYIAWIGENNLQNYYYLQLTWITHFDFRKTKQPQ